MVNESSGKLILWVTLGTLILLHGIGKLQNGAVIAGFYARFGAWLIAVNMLYAFGLVHGAELLAIDPTSGGLQR
jgi:putative oxidoreductase